MYYLVIPNPLFILGLNGEVRADGNKLADWQIYPLEFKKEFLSALLADAASWQAATDEALKQVTEPCLLRATLTITGQPQDTFVSMKVGYFLF